MVNGNISTGEFKISKAFILLGHVPSSSRYALLETESTVFNIHASITDICDEKIVTLSCEINNNIEL